MAASDTFITELDYAAAQKKIKVRDDGAGVLTPYAVLLANDFPVDTAHPLPITGTQLASLVTALTTGAPGQAGKKMGDTADAAADVVLGIGGVRVDTVGAIAEADGKWTRARIGKYGGWYTEKATNDDATQDNVQSMPVPGIAGWVQKSKDYSSAANDPLWTPASGKIAVVTDIFVEWSGGTDGIIQIWGSVSATGDTAYSANTDRLLFQIHATPSTKGADGYHAIGFWPMFGANYPVNVVRSTAIVCTVALSGYEK